MPTYTYECDACGHSFDHLQSMLDKRLKKCPVCSKNKLVRLIGAGSGVIFKGTGFYETDYKKKSESSQAEKGSKKQGASSSNPGKKKDSTKKAASKPAAKE